MNRILQILLLLTLIGFTACGGDGNKKVTSVVKGIDFREVKMDTTAVLSNHNEGSTIHVSLSILAATNNEGINKAIINSGLLFPEYVSTDSLSTDAAVKAFARKFIHDYQQEYNEILGMGEDQNGITLEYKVATKIAAYSKNTFSYEASIDQKMGSTEPSHITVVKTFNTQNGHIMSLDDIFRKGYYDKLTDAIVNEIKEQKGCKTMSDMQEQMIFKGIDPYPADNFILTDDDITFVYNEDEIAPHTMGQIRVTLKLSDLKDICK